MMHILAIANEKGGVAKTTTAISLAAALADAGQHVLAIDLDSQANLTLGLGFQPARLRLSSADVLMNAATVLSVSRETSVPNLDLVPATPEIGLSERFLPMRQDYQLLLRQALTQLALSVAYDFVILDCPPSLGAVTYNALYAAHRLIAPTQPEYFSAYGLRSMLAAVRRVRGSAAAGAADNRPPAPDANPNLQYHILITLMDRRNRIHRTLAEQLRLTFGDGLFQTAIEIDTRLRESAVAGKPITHHAPNSRSAQQYRALAQEVLQHVQAKA